MKISVVGSINMDMTVTAERIPLKGETLKGENLRYIPGGKGANQAVAMARLGADVEMFGCVGNDSAGKALIQNMKEAGIETSHIKVIEGTPTGIAMITVGENDNTIVVVAGANGCVDKAYIDSIKEAILDSEIVLLQHEIPLETVSYVVDLCHAHGVKVVLNPAPAAPVSKEILDKVSYLTPNEHEAAILFGEKTLEEMLRLYPGKLLITQGSRGASICLENGQIVQVPARKAEVVDTTGAGDTLNGAFTMQIANKVPVEEALRFANVAASLSTEKFGAQGGMPEYEAVIKELEK
ncbi:MAG TPA: ribokinase [Candidatus Blautia avistercoris]|nr:ribokinase [Candidatus Blautia avistercoris]